jgi:hypothetical protein
MTLAERQKEFAGYFLAGNPQLNIAAFPLVSACAETGNATAENLVFPTTTGPKDHGSDGSMQWREGRLANLKSWSAGNGLAWDTLQAQAWFTVYETERDYKGLYADLIAGAKSLATLTANIEAFFERPATLADVDTRIKYAQEVWNLMQGVVTPVVIDLPPLSRTGSGTTSISAAEAAFQAAKSKYDAAAISLAEAKKELSAAVDTLSKVSAYVVDQLKTAQDLIK